MMTMIKMAFGKIKNQIFKNLALNYKYINYKCIKFCTKVKNLLTLSKV